MMKNWVKLMLLASLSVTGLVGCLDNDDPNIPGLVVTPNKDRVIISDSFERDEIFADPNVQTLFGWRGFIWDFGTPVLGLDGNQVDAVIFNNTEVAPAADGENALYFYGRPGNSVHNLYLISQRYDLSVASEQNQTEFNTAILSFNYLTMQLNDAQDQADGVEEYLRVEVCAATVNECGVNEDILDVNGLNSDNWVTVFDHRDASPDLDGLNFNGQNHQQSDWRQAQVIIDLNDQNIIVDKANVIFRFTARMRDGLEEDQQNCDDEPNDDNSEELEHYRKKLKKKYKKKKRLKHWIHKLEERLAKLKRHCEDNGRYPATNSHYDHKDKDVKCHPSECEFRIDHLKSKIERKKKYLHKIKEKIERIKERISELEEQGHEQPPHCQPTNNDGLIRFVDGAAIDNVNGLASPLTIDELF